VIDISGFGDINNHMNYNELLTELAWGNEPFLSKIRVPKACAQKWLLENKSVISKGTVHWLQIKDIGLGICEVALRKDGKNTLVVKEFEELVINNTRGYGPHIVIVA
jgi:hypothetical protein